MLKTRLAAIAAAAVLALAACSSDPAPVVPDVSPTAGLDAAALDGVTWGTDADGRPTLTWDGSIAVTSDGARLVKDGDGAALEEGQKVALDYVIYSGSDAMRLGSTYELGTPETVDFVKEQATPTLFSILQGTHVGAQVIFATLDFSSDPDENGVYPTILLATTVSDAYTVADRAQGTPVPPVEGLPKVTLDDTGKPTIDLTGVEKPTELVSQLLIKGDGKPVADGQTLTVNYTGVLWDGTQFDSSWDRGKPASFSFGPGKLIDGWTQGLAGVPVGSQVLLVVPPEFGYGDQDKDGIPPGSTLVFVVDILAAS